MTHRDLAPLHQELSKLRQLSDKLLTTHGLIAYLPLSDNVGHEDIPIAINEWTKVNEQVSCMLVDNTPERTLVMLRCKGSFTANTHSHKQSETIMVVEGEVYDYTNKIVAGKGDMISFDSEALHGIEYRDCMIIITFTPPLNHRKI